MIKLKNILNEEHGGFQGLTHWLIAMFLFFCLWLLPTDYARSYIGAINSNKLFFFLIIFIIGGASLVPDLDSSPIQEGGSTAVYQLGFLGYWLSIAFITISGVVYSLFHTKYDAKPPSQHRMLFHAPIVPIGIFVYTVYLSKSLTNLGYSNILQMIKEENTTLLFEYTGLIVMLFFCGVSVYLGANMLLYKLLKLFSKQRYTQFICLAIMVISVIYMLFMPIIQLELIFFSFSLGYLFHIIADVFSKGSCPLFFPIPLPYKGLNFKKLQLWRKPYFISSKFAITTGGALNTILNFAMMGLDFILVWMLFIKK